MRYFTKKGDTERGPYEVGALEQALREGRISPATLGRREGSEEWVPIDDLLIGPGMPHVEVPESQPPKRAARSTVEAGGGELNPYAAPMHAASTEGAEATPTEVLARKPIRVWVLQLLVAVQLAATLYWGLPYVLEIKEAGWLVGPVVTQLVTQSIGLGAVLLSLQRIVPRPDVVAPLFAGTWWLWLAGVTIETLITFDRVRPPDVMLWEAIAATLAIHGVLLWLVGSLFLHPKTRRYLKRLAEPPG